MEILLTALDNEHCKLKYKISSIHEPCYIRSWIEYTNGFKYIFFSHYEYNLQYWNNEKKIQYLKLELNKFIKQVIDNDVEGYNLYNVVWKFNDSDEIYNNEIWCKNPIKLINNIYFFNHEKEREILEIKKIK